MNSLIIALSLYPGASDVVAAIQLAAATYITVEAVDLTTELQQQPTAEGRHLWAARVGNGDRAMLVTAGEHGDEWSGPSAALALIDALATDPRVDATTVWVVPLANPDGYQYALDTDPSWRKSRNGTGVDLNRQYVPGWGGPCGGSTSPTDATYQGPSAMSEVEAQTIAALIERERPDVVVPLHDGSRFVYHSYSGCSGATYGAHAVWMEAQALDARAAMTAQAQPLGCALHGYGLAYTDAWLHQYALAQGALSLTAEIYIGQDPSQQHCADARAYGVASWALDVQPLIVGQVRSCDTDEPIEAVVDVSGSWYMGERWHSRARDGRFAITLPSDTYTLTVSAAGYEPEVRTQGPGSLVVLLRTAGRPWCRQRPWEL